MPIKRLIIILGLLCLVLVAIDSLVTKESFGGDGDIETDKVSAVFDYDKANLGLSSIDNIEETNKIDSKDEANLSGEVFLLPVSEDGLHTQDQSLASVSSSVPRASAVYDVAGRHFIFTNNIDKKLPIASITKLMTAIVILENTASSDYVMIKSEYLNVDGDGADLYANEILKRDDLLNIMLIGSINDAAVAFQGYLKEKGLDLVSLMNEKANELGMSQTEFRDPAGLDDDAYSSVRDIVKLVEHVDRYPIIWEILRKSKFSTKSLDNKINHTVVNTNKLLSSISGIIGGKTGYTDKSKGSLALLLNLNNKKIITVVLGSDDRFLATTNLINNLK